MDDSVAKPYRLSELGPKLRQRWFPPHATSTLTAAGSGTDFSLR